MEGVGPGVGETWVPIPGPPSCPCDLGPDTSISLSASGDKTPVPQSCVRTK